ncbi:MAG: acetyltransferase [Prochlorococcaceae cyanobacterium]
MALLIIGCGGHSKVVSEIAERMGKNPSFYLDDAAAAIGPHFLGRPVLAALDQPWKGEFAVAIGHNLRRQQVFERFLQQHPEARPATLIDPSSVVSVRCQIGAGTVVMPLCVVNAGSQIGCGVILNTRCSVDHDNQLGDFTSLAPAVALGGNLHVGERSAIGIGATVRHGLCIGADVVVGAGALVLHNLPDRCVAYGNPARVIRSRCADDRYL